jgi:hypothetical protein
MQPHKRETWDVEYGELTEDVRMSYYRGYWDGNEPAMDEYDVPAGTTVRIVMVSPVSYTHLTLPTNVP